MKLSDYVMEFLADQGVRHVFMLPGGGAMHLNDSLGKSDRLEYVCNLHEQASSIAAEAYSQISGLGVLLVTTGPGGTNAITGVAAAWLESTPLVVISGQVKRADLVGGRGTRQIGFQEIDIVSVVKPITKFSTIVMDPRDIRLVLQQAFWIAQNGRKGPVWIDIPLDIQSAEIDPAVLMSYPTPVEARVCIDTIKYAVATTLEILKSAKRPAVIVGNGVRHAGAIETFLRWAERIGIPVLTTWKTLDIMADSHPLYVGRPGAVGQRNANFVQQKADALLCIGARLDYGQTAYNHANFAPMARKVVVDIDPAEIAKLSMKLDVGLVADAGDYLSALSMATADVQLPDWNDWRSLCFSLKKRYPIVLPSYRDPAKGVHNYVLVETIGSLLRHGDNLVPGSSGACSEVTAQTIPVPTGIRFINSHGLGAMGFGIPAALGACLASGRRRTICIDGDGGFPMNAQELAVIAHFELPIKFFVLSNEGYNSIRTTQNNYFEKRLVACDKSSGLYLPKIVSYAEGAGISYSSITSQIGLREQIEALLDKPKPHICEVQMAPGQFTQPKVVSHQTPNGQMATMPLENMWPFLDHCEMMAIMAE